MMPSPQTTQTADPEVDKIHFDIILADGFVLTELSGTADVLRIANRVSPKPAFSWTYRSVQGGEVTSSTGAIIRTQPLTQPLNQPMTRAPTAQYAFVLGNADPDCPALSLRRTIADYTYRGAQVFLLAEAASRYIRDRGDADQPLSTHWENSAFLRERSERFDASYTIATVDGPVVTCAGMGATVNVTLAVIRRHLSSAATMTVADILLHENIRDFSSLQPFSGQHSTATGDEALDDCIRIMQANVEDPIPIHELVDVLGLSNRSLERRFRTYLNTTPNNFYRELRLSKANNLLLNTTLSLREIGLACGYPSGFSAVFKSFYGVTPFGLRKQRRQYAQ